MLLDFRLSIYDYPDKVLRPDLSTPFIRSLIAAQRDSPFGLLPVWAYQGPETWCMTGHHAVAITADAYIKGVRGFDANAALKAMAFTAIDGNYGDLADYMKLGYVPIDMETEAGCHTQEYAYDDWAVAQMAKATGASRLAGDLAGDQPRTCAE